ncbi:hypothetical protein HDU98_003970 [Podochytrium sp. JEL0797]|nr:hypothetical protein HDU98_003970 [Podochytrium sp. JEL0797]
MDLPPPYYDEQTAPPAFATADLEWPHQLHFRRSIDDTGVVHVFATDSSLATPILAITNFMLPSYSFLEFKKYNHLHVYPGTTAGSRVQDLRVGYEMDTFESKIVLPELTGPEAKPKRQKFVYVGRDSRRVVDYVVHDSSERGREGVQGGFGVGGVMFRWVLVVGREGSPSSSSSSSSSCSSVDVESVCHELQYAHEKSWITVATTSALRHKFYTAEVNHTKSGVYGTRPLFARVDFEMSRLVGLGFSSSALKCVVGVLWSLWMGDVLNKEGRLGEVVRERMRLYKRDSLSYLADYRQ